MKTNKKLGISLLMLAFMAGGVGMIAYQTNAKQEAPVYSPQPVVADVNEIENEEKDVADEPIVGSPTISESKAIEIADKAYTGNGKITQTELEMENGVLVYAIEFTESDGNEVDVKINAKTGSVVKIESDKTEVEDED